MPQKHGFNHHKGGGRNHGGSGADGVAATDTTAPRVTRTAVLRDNGMVDTFA